MSIADIYFQPQYGKLYEKIENGTCEVFEHCSELGTVYHLFIKRQIPEKVYNEVWHDLITPYGYGGPLVVSCAEGKNNLLVNEFKQVFERYCLENNIVSEFIRFHPLMNNHTNFEGVYDIEFNRKTIYIDLESEEHIWGNMKSTSRNRIRKATGLNIQVVNDSSQRSLSKFIELYYKTMDKHNAAGSYYFHRDYFIELMNLNKSSEIFNAVLNGKTIASIIVLIGKDLIHYHLGATDPEYYSLSPNNILFYEVAKWGAKAGFQKFHLGGGYSHPGDGIFRFKQTLNQHGVLNFYVGKKIWKLEIFSRLVEARSMEDDFDKNSTFFPVYRNSVIANR